MFVSHDDLRQVQHVIESRDVAEEEQLTRNWVEVVIHRACQSFSRNNNFRIAAIAHFQNDVFGAWQNLAICKLHNSQRSSREHVSCECSVRTRAG